MIKNIKKILIIGIFLFLFMGCSEQVIEEENDYDIKLVYKTRAYTYDCSKFDATDRVEFIYLNKSSQEKQAVSKCYDKFPELFE